MNENQPNFESLRHLLALKRYETPPPGYFNNFSRQVIARVRAGEAEAQVSLLERLFAKAPWLLKLFREFEMKPVFACGFASALCLLLLFGAILAQRPESVSGALLQPATQEVASFVPATPTALTQPVNQMLIADNSTNPVFNFQGSAPLLSQASPSFNVQPVSYFPSGN
jgi:hypothetical protein